MDAPSLWPHDQGYYRQAGLHVENHLVELDRAGGGSRGWTITTRLKTDESIRAKVERKRITRPDYGPEKLTDLVGVRVVVDSAEVEVKLAGYLRGRIFNRLRERDCEFYVDRPREDGYRAIHLVGEVDVTLGATHPIPVELQIRTMLQHQWAVLSRAEFYKSVREIPPHLLTRMRALSEQLYCAEIESEYLRRERVLDELHRITLETLRTRVLEGLGSPQVGPEEARKIGHASFLILEIDKQLRRAFVDSDDARERALTALGELCAEAASTAGIDLRRMDEVLQRVKAFLNVVPYVP